MKAWLFIALAALGACGSSADLRRLSGPAPNVVLVLPIIDDAGDPQARAALMATIGHAMRGRGYYVVPVEVGLTMVVDAGYPGGAPVPEAATAEVGRALGADGCLQIRIVRWEATWDPALVDLDYEVQYRLSSSINGATLWEHTARGGWSAAGGRAFIDHDSAFEQFLGRSLDSAGEESRFHSPVDVCRTLQRNVAALMPER